MMVFVALKPLLLLSLISYLTTGMPVEKMATVIMQLARQFHSGGVYLLVSSEQTSGGCWNNTLRLLAKDCLPTAVINMERAFTIAAPSERTSVYVMQSAGMKDRRPLQEVR